MDPKPIPLRSAVTWGLRILLAGVFGYAALAKLSDPADFVSDIERYRLLPHPLAIALGVYLPWLEIACAVCVVTGWCYRGAITLIFVLCLVFGAAIASAWMRGLDISCGCFGHRDATTALPVALIRSGALAAVALLLLRKKSEVNPTRDESIS